MPIDASIYGNIRPIEMPSMLDSQTKASNLSSLALQQKSMAMQQDAASKQMGREDQQAQIIAHLQKASIWGNTLESLAGLPENERAAAYPKAVEELTSAGVLKPGQVLGQYDSGGYRSDLMKYRQSKEGIDQHLSSQMKLAQIEELKAQTEKHYADAKAERSKGSILGKKLSPGEKKADEEFGKDASEYYYSGGKSNTEKNLSRLQEAIATLEKKPDLTGGLSTKIPWLKEDDQQDWMNPELASVRDDIRAAIQGGLKQVLGGQFTEREAVAMFNRAFNPRLSSEENVKRATAELNALKNMSADKDRAMQYFENNGTLVGFKASKTRTPENMENQYANEQPNTGKYDFGMKSANASELTTQDMEAIHWAQKNKSDPRAQQILKLHGVK
jgi:hypothetical protein